MVHGVITVLSLARDFRMCAISASPRSRLFISSIMYVCVAQDVFRRGGCGSRVGGGGFVMYLLTSLKAIRFYLIIFELVLSFFFLIM